MSKTKVNNLLLDYITRLNFTDQYFVVFDHIKHLIKCGADNFTECANATTSLVVINFLVDEYNVNNFAELLNKRKGLLFDYYLIKKLKIYKFINDNERRLFISATNGEIFSYYPELLDKLPADAEPYLKLYNRRKYILFMYLLRDICDIIMDYVSYELIDIKHDINYLNKLYMKNLNYLLINKQ